VYEGRNGQSPGGVKVFEKRFRDACANLAAVFQDTVKDEEEMELGIRHVNLLDVLKADSEWKVPEGCKENAVLKGLAPTASKLGGSYLIANAMIVGQYINLFEGLRKSSQESLCVTREWSKELKILSSFMTSFNECNHTITDEFFRDQ